MSPPPASTRGSVPWHHELQGEVEQFHDSGASPRSTPELKQAGMKMKEKTKGRRRKAPEAARARLIGRLATKFMREPQLAVALHEDFRAAIDGLQEFIADFTDLVPSASAEDIKALLLEGLREAANRLAKAA